MGILRMILAFLRAFLARRGDLAAENAMLRHQLIVLQRSIKRPRLGKSDRAIFVWLSGLWSVVTRRRLRAATPHAAAGAWWWAVCASPFARGPRLQGRCIPRSIGPPR